MANTGYIINKGIQQVFTTGPYSGSVVSSSYSTGSTIFGSTVNHNQSFISGTLDALSPCTSVYSRYYQDPILCPASGIAPPTITSAAALCTPYNYYYNFALNLNEGTSSVPYTVLQYSTSPTFTTNVGYTIYGNLSGSNTSVNVSSSQGLSHVISSSRLPSLPISTTLVYFRAFNSSSIATTSSFSNVISASCAVAPRVVPTLWITNVTTVNGDLVKSFTITGAPNEVVTWSTSNLVNGTAGSHITLVDSNSVNYTVSNSVISSGSITLPNSGVKNFTITYGANVPSSGTNNTSMVITFKDFDGTNILQPGGIIDLLDSTDAVPTISLGNTICRRNNCGDNSTCNLDYSVFISNAPVGAYAALAILSSVGASVSLLYISPLNYRLTYSEPNALASVTFQLLLKNSSGVTIASQPYIYLSHPSQAPYLPLC